MQWLHPRRVVTALAKIPAGLLRTGKDTSLGIVIILWTHLMSVQNYLLEGLEARRSLAKRSIENFPTVTRNYLHPREELKRKYGSELFVAKEYKQLINTGAIKLDTHQQRVFTPETLDCLEVYSQTNNRTPGEQAALRQMAMRIGWREQGEAEKVLHGAGAAEVRPDEAPPAGARASESVGASHAGPPLPPRLMKRLRLTEDTEWLWRANKQAMIAWLNYQRYPQRRLKAQEASHDLTPDILRRVLWKMLCPTIIDCPENYVALVSFVYPGGPEWLSNNRGELSAHHQQGISYGIAGCITHQHITAVAGSNKDDEVTLRQFLGQPLPPGPADMSINQWAGRYLEDQLP